MMEMTVISTRVPAAELFILKFRQPIASYKVGKSDDFAPHYTCPAAVADHGLCAVCQRRNGEAVHDDRGDERQQSFALPVRQVYAWLQNNAAMRDRGRMREPLFHQLRDPTQWCGCTSSLSSGGINAIRHCPALVACKAAHSASPGLNQDLTWRAVKLATMPRTQACVVT
ncbi:hypothetical protein [Hyphomicrobium sp.]|uniref:hypothetical protein n=1 Tax=Hyphomicrobium sp. TaxID=82 RepID=UPI001DA0D993|nr:hypothetical protein [Hyphomicrobium sp.]MBY0560102.1 hypothetical protein [Hyphomicrobium sp.]